jgi:hypothetical protein
VRKSGKEPHGGEEVMSGAAARLRAAILRGYNFSRVKTLVDINGGDGMFLAFLLQAYKPLHGIVFDSPWAAETARVRLAAEGVSERCAVMSGDMLETVPTGYDMYVLREVVRRYKDAHVERILRNCCRAMSPYGKLLIIEAMASEGNKPSFAKVRDLKLMISSEGRERTEAEFRALLTKAGLRIKRLIPTSAEACIIEAERVESE